MVCARQACDVKAHGRTSGGHAARVPAVIERWSRSVFGIVAAGLLALTTGLAFLSPWALLGLLVAVPFLVVGVRDITQREHAIQRNFPVIGHLRYLLESLRPELYQYFVESESEENPISREKRAVVYQRAKNELDTLPFGTRRDVAAIGYEWLSHSLSARAPTNRETRVLIGGSGATRPYASSILNVSAMSFGSLSANAIRALNRGAKLGGFSHNTGEGGLSEYHLEHGGDLVWQIGTGYFGCRTLAGEFCPERFAQTARGETVKMIEIKLSQGAKPGHGGILPARKVTPEIAALRGVPLGQDIISPPAHSAFSSPLEMVQFIAELRRLSGGKPVGFKLCVGSRREFLSVCKAMVETGITPDFITVDGGEGGTGAAPLEFSNSVGAPLAVGLSFVDDALVGSGLRERIRIIVAGKILTGFHVVSRLALGADVCNSARGMMFAVGCIQALKCNTDLCPVGVATQNPALARGLDPGTKADRVANFHARTVESVYTLLAAAGLDDPTAIGRRHIFRRVGEGDVRSYAEIYPELERNALRAGTAPEGWNRLWDGASAAQF